jgi:hypothetical protein
MNRAWIPAGALAGMSVAGLIALGPLTDSLGNQVAFPTKIATAGSEHPPSERANSEVAVSITVPEPVGQVETAALTRGGHAKVSARTNSTEGTVALKVTPGTGTHSSGSTHATTQAPPAAAPKTAVTPKKAAPRQNSIGDIGESNPDHGLAGGSQQTSGGETSSTPASP